MSQDPFQEREAEKYANPIPSREFIIEHLTKREKPANREELAVELNIEGEEQIEALRRRLRAMERDGQLVFTRRQCYALPERLDLLKGTVIGHRDGFGFLRVEGRKDDLYLSSEQMKMCIHGDQILAQPLAGIFSLSAGTMGLCVTGLRVLAVSFVFAGANIAIQGVFQATEGGVQSLLVSLLRQLIFVLPAAWLFAHLLPAGVWLAFPIAEVLTAVIAAVLLLHTAGKGRLSQRDHAVSLDK